MRRHRPTKEEIIDLILNEFHCQGDEYTLLSCLNLDYWDETILCGVLQDTYGIYVYEGGLFDRNATLGSVADEILGCF